jgi:hypothetical protein
MNREDNFGRSNPSSGEKIAIQFVEIDIHLNKDTPNLFSKVEFPPSLNYYIICSC